MEAMGRNWMSARGGSQWNPTKDEQGNQKKEPTGSEILIGQYLGATQRDFGDGPVNVHHFDAEHIGGEDKKEQVELLGTKILDDQLSDVIEGVTTRVEWLGKKDPKNSKNRAFHDWDVQFDKDEQMEAKQRGDSQQEPQQEQPQQESQQESQQTAEQSSQKEESDDLPF